MAESSEAWRDILLTENTTSCLPFPEAVVAFAENRTEKVSNVKNFNLFYLFSIMFGAWTLCASLLDSDHWLFRFTSDHTELEKKR